MQTFNDFREIWLVDFEYKAPDGERPEPHCLVARELRSGRLIRLWKNEFGSKPPFPIDETTLFVSYNAVAELNCFRVLGWEMPKRVLDLYVEFRWYLNKARKKGIKPVKHGLLNALAHFGLDSIGTVEKKEMRDLAIRGEPFTFNEKVDLLDYCQSDVDALQRLLPVMASRLNRFALLRGRYMAAVSSIEHIGIPIDTDSLTRFSANKERIQDRLKEVIDANFHVYGNKTIDRKKFREYLLRHGMWWPCHDKTASLDLSDETFEEMIYVYPQLRPLYDLSGFINRLKLGKLAIGHDGRNRTSLLPFASSTGRNQPSNARFIFGPHVWMRGFIKPPEGYGLAYLDWAQQEFGIAAVLSNDLEMLAAYQSGDCWLSFAKQAGALPPDAVREKDNEQAEAIRDKFKVAGLGVQYVISEHGLARQLRKPGVFGAQIMARALLRSHRETYPQFWRWAEATVDYATQNQSMSTCFDWRVLIDDDSNSRALQNFPMQATGAEVMRLACCLATENGIQVCAPVHDALLIQSPLDRLDEDIRRTQALMAEASRTVLRGFELRSDCKVIRYPNRYMDDRGRKMWDRVWSLIDGRDVASLREAA